MTARFARSHRLFIAALAGAVLAWSGSPLVARAVQAKQVTAFVTVTAPETGPLKTLTAHDFSVREDNAAREVSGAELATDPLSIAVLVITSLPAGGGANYTQDLRTSLSNFMKTVQTASPDAQISLADVSGHAVTTVDFTTKTPDLDKGILKLIPSTSAGAVMNEAMMTASKALEEKPAPRRAIVTVNFNVPEETTADPKFVEGQLRKSGASIWSVSVYQKGADANGGEPGAQSRDADLGMMREAVLNDMTGKSGGLHLQAFTPAVLDSMLQRIANSLLSQYSITYARPGNGTPKKITGETTGGGKVLFSAFIR